MLIPLPEGELHDALLVQGADVLQYLKKQGGLAVVEEAMLDFLRRYPKSRAVDFLDCLTVLFALGLITHDAFRIAIKGVQ